MDEDFYQQQQQQMEQQRLNQEFEQWRINQEMLSNTDDAKPRRSRYGWVVVLVFFLITLCLFFVFKAKYHVGFLLAKASEIF